MSQRATHGTPHSDTLITRVPLATPDERVAAVRDRIINQAASFEVLTYVYVVDAERRPVGVTSLTELLQTNGSTHMTSCMRTPVITAHAALPRRRIAALAIHHGVKAIPIVDAHGALSGIMSTDAILATLHRAHVEDTLTAAGIRTSHALTDIGHASLSVLVRHRLPWLLLGLAGSMIGALLVRAFEGVIATELALAAFVPLVIYMSDALGTQAQALYVRALAVEPIAFRALLPREAAAALAMSTACAALLGAFAFAVVGSPIVAGIVALALLLAMVASSLLAIAITAAIVHFRRDPALGSGPLATVCSDIVTIAVFFLVARAMLA